MYRGGYMKKLQIFSILFLIIIFIGLPYYVYGASASISSSVTTMEIDETATITASVSSTEAWNLNLISSGGILTGTTVNADSAGEEVSKSVMSANFSASNPGTYTITLSGDITGNDLVKQSVNQSLSINVIDKIEQPSQPSEPATEPSISSEPTETTTPETPKSSDATLSSLTAQINGKSLEVSRDSSRYSATIEADVTAVTFTVKANSSKATIDSNKSTSGIGFVKNSGSSANKTYTMSNLKEGNNVIKITVIAEDKTERNYTFTVTRKVAENQEEAQVVPNIVEEVPEIEKDNEEEKKDEEDENGFGLKSLVITGVELYPEFNINTYKYNATIEGSDSVEVIAIATDEEAEVEIVGNKNLVMGENLITILVKKDDEVKTYQIILNKIETVTTTGLTTTDDALIWGLTWKHLSIIIAAILIIIAVVIKLVFLSKKTIDDDYDYDSDNGDSEEDDNDLPNSKRKEKNNNIYYNEKNSKRGRRFK